MEMSEPASNALLRPRKRSRGAHLRLVALVTTILGLITSNLLSLVDDRFHSAAYDLLTTVGSRVGQTVLSKMTAHSPTTAVEKKITNVTQRLKSDYTNLDAKYKGLNTTHNSLQAKYSKLDTTYSSLQTKHATLEAKTVKRTEALKKFSSNTMARVVKNKTVELASLPERAIPYAGIAVMLGVTAYEINSDCELLKEINSLAQENEFAPLETNTVCGFKLPSTDEVWGRVKFESKYALQPAYDQLVKLSPKPPSMPSFFNR